MHKLCMYDVKKYMKYYAYMYKKQIPLFVEFHTLFSVGKYAQLFEYK